VRTFFGFFLLYFVLIIANWWVLTHLSFLGFAPELVLITFLAVAVFGREVSIYVFGFFCGLVLDFMGNCLFGGYCLCFLVSARLVIFMRGKVDFGSLPVQMLMVFGFSFFVKLFYSVLGLTFASELVFGRLDHFLLTAFLNGLIAPFAFVFIRKYFLAIR
jgi:rod shape-determining protein MreD